MDNTSKCEKKRFSQLFISPSKCAWAKVINLFCWINQKSYSPFLSSQVSILNQEREWERCSRWVVALMAEQYRLYLLPSSSLAFFYQFSSFFSFSICVSWRSVTLYIVFFFFLSLMRSDKISLTTALSRWIWRQHCSSRCKVPAAVS